MRVDKACHGKDWFKRLSSAGKIRKIAIPLTLSTFDGYHYDAAFDHVEHIFERYADGRITKDLRALYHSNESDLAFKKTLTHRLSRLYYLKFLMREIHERYPSRKVVFLPSNGLELYRTDGCDIFDFDQLLDPVRDRKQEGDCIFSVDVFFWSRVISYVRAMGRKFFLGMKIAVLPVWLLFRCLVNKRAPRKKMAYDYAITVVSPNRQLINEIQKVDFLIDDKHLEKDQVVFMSPKGITSQARTYFLNNGLNFVEDITGFISVKEVVEIFSAYRGLLFSAFHAPNFIGETGLKGIYFYAVWKSLSRNISIKKLITHCDYEIKALFRNIIFHQNGCTTYLYMDSSNFGGFVVKKDTNNEFRHHFFGFLLYDWFIAWNQKAIEYFQKSFCQFKGAVNIGCFWSEHVRQIQADINLVADFKSRLYAGGYREGMSLLSIFDSTYYDYSMTTYKDGIMFLEGLYALINELQDAFFILKEKNLRSYHELISTEHERINALYRQLEAHPRCLFAGRRENSSKIIAISDMVISFPFTSTTLEAISARKKAVWYDAAGKFKDTYYDEFPGLICHSCEELLRRSKELLYQISQDDYEKYLDKYIKGKVEPYLDGYAITRFRSLLSSGSFENSTKSADLSRTTFGGTY